MSSISHEPEPSEWPPASPTVADLSDDDVDFMI